MILFRGKARDMSYIKLAIAYLIASRPIEPLEAVNFSKN